MSNWKECKLGEHILINSKNIDKNYPYKEIDYLDTGSITRGKIDSLQHFTLTDAPSRAKRIVKDNDIVLSMVRPVQRHYGYLRNTKPNTVASTGFVVLTNKESIDPYFLYSLLTQDDITEYLDVVAEGSTSAYPAFTPDVIENLPILLPPLPEQRAIAGVLSSLDDKIDLLHRQNKTLEAMAEALWQKMFVEDADPDWKRGKLGDYGQIICGKTPSKKVAEYFGGHIPFIKIPDMHGNVFIFETEDSLTETGVKSQQSKTIPAKSICVSCIATVGLVCMNAVDSQTNQQINTIIPNNEFQRYFLFLVMRNMTDDLLARASGGTATDNLNTGDFSRIEISKPPENDIQKFDDLVRAHFEKIYANQIQIRTLSRLRDTLLPKLMSGEVRVRI